MVLALVLFLLASFSMAAPVAPSQIVKRSPARFVGAHSLNWPFADKVIGPLRADKLFYPPGHPLPARWPGNSYGLARGALAIIAYKVPTTHVLSFVKSIPSDRPVTMVFWQEPEAHMTASRFLRNFEQQSRLIRSAHRPNIKVAFDASTWRYQRVYRKSYNCQFVPPARFVNYYYGDVYEQNDQTLRAEPQFQRWVHCTAGRGRARGLAEYGLGDCQGDSYRAHTIMTDAAYLANNFPDLQVLSYWWTNTSPHSGTSCHTDWQFTHEPAIATWRALESLLPSRK